MGVQRVSSPRSWQSGQNRGQALKRATLAETFAILVREASLDAERATWLTLDRARERLRPLEADTEELVRLLVGEYYHALLTQREALLRVGVLAFQTFLARTEDLEQGLQELADLLHAPEREAWQALRPVEEPIPPEGPVRLAELKAANRLVAFTGQAHRRLRDDLVAWAEGMAESPYRAGLRLLIAGGRMGGAHHPLGPQPAAGPLPPRHRPASGRAVSADISPWAR